MARNLTTQDISWFLDLYSRDQLNLDPPYQRRSVWSPRDKRYFIDTILNNCPAPAVFLHKTSDDNGVVTYHVVDGKQRLQTIIEFTQNKVYIPDNFSDIKLQKKRWRDLESETRKRFWNYVLVTEMLPDVSDAVVRDTFERINRNSRKLTPQEMRHAKYDGWFIQFVEDESQKSEWVKLGVVTLARTKRMADVQFISELCAVVLRGTVLGFNQDALDNLYAEYDDTPELGTFVEEDFVSNIENVKTILVKLLELEPSLKKYFKVLSHFYSLWTYLSLDNTHISDVETLAERYKAFMALVEKTLESANAVTDDTELGQVEIQKAALNYANSARGATTDLNPRSKRHDALVTGICEAGAVDDENS